ncbi:MAG: agmatine deiminase family protein [Phycisphaerales bacterium]
MSKRAALLLCLAAGTALVPSASAQVLSRDGVITYPQGSPVPRYLTDLERWYWLRHPIGGDGPDAPTATPTGPIHCVAEYEPMEGIVIGWEGGGTLNAIQAEMAMRITTTGNSRVFVGVDSASIQSSATTTLTNAGCNMSRVTFVTKTLDSIWLRDYGPRYIYEGNCRAIVDHKYNRPSRVNDDTFPAAFATFKKHAFYELGWQGHTLIHGGGNFHLDSIGFGYATRLITNENNPPFTTYAYPEAEIRNTWQAYQNLNVAIMDPFPTSVDATQHIDMWMQIVDVNKVIISDWPNNPGSTQDVICDNATTFMQSRGYTVFRVPAYSISGTHYTFTNMVMCNNVVLVPSYTNATAGAQNATAAATIQSALPPGKTVYSINCQNIIGLAGAVHCIVQHVPVNKNGTNPGIFLRSPNGGETLTPGQIQQVAWISDDDVTTANVDVLLSTDGGATFPTTLAAAIVDNGAYYWTIPNINTATARIRMVVRDAQGNTSLDDSDANFTIGNPPPVCYANCDGSSSVPILNVNDFICFNNLFAAGDTRANCDGSTSAPTLNVNDFTCFLNAFAAGCP